MNRLADHLFDNNVDDPEEEEHFWLDDEALVPDEEYWGEWEKRQEATSHPEVGSGMDYVLGAGPVRAVEENERCSRCGGRLPRCECEMERRGCFGPPRGWKGLVDRSRR